MAAPSRLRANAKYRRDHKDQISITVPKGDREVWKGRAEELGMGLAEYVRALVRKDLESRG